MCSHYNIALILQKKLWIDAWNSFEMNRCTMTLSDA